MLYSRLLLFIYFIYESVLLLIPRVTDIENKFIVGKGKEEGRDKLGVWD